MEEIEDFKHIILPVMPTIEHKSITGSKLPTYNQVILCLLAHNEKNQFNLFDKFELTITSLKNVTEQVKLHYKNAHIQIIDDKNIIRSIKHFFNNEYKTLVRLRKRLSINEDNKRKKFQTKLEKTMPFWPKRIVSKMKNSKKGKTPVKKMEIDQHINFLKSMMGNRLLSYSSLPTETDPTDETSIEFNIKYDSHNNTKRKLITEKQEITTSSDTFEQFDTIDSFSERQTQKRFKESLRRNHKRLVKTGTHIFVPHDILKSGKLQSTAMRNDISPVGLAAIVQTLIEVCDGEPEKVNLHYSQSFRCVKL